MFDNIGDQLVSTLITDNRGMLIVEGLGNTFLITVIALAMGVVIGLLVAMAKVSFKDSRGMKWLVVILDIYTTVIRGTPMVVQLLIMYFIIFAAVPGDYAVYVASLSFGINSGAYVSEIIRGGINSVPAGQMEAGRSLGLSTSVTMRKIIIPQAIKNSLPALGNEFITLFKDTSIVGYIAVMDLTRAGDLIRSRTFQPLVPLLVVAAIYLVFVLLITVILRKVEKHFAKNESR